MTSYAFLTRGGNRALCACPALSFSRLTTAVHSNSSIGSTSTVRSCEYALR